MGNLSVVAVVARRGTTESWKRISGLGREVLNWTGQQAVVAVMTKVEVEVEVEAVEVAATGGVRAAYGLVDRCWPGLVTTIRN